MTRFRPAGAGFGRPQPLPDATGGFSFQVAVGPRGDALVAWRYGDGSTPPEEIDIRDGGCCSGLKAVLIPARTRTPGPATTLWPRGTDVYEVKLSMRDARHYAVAANVAVLRPGTNNYPRDAGAQASFAGANGGWTRPVPLPRSLASLQALAVTRAATRFIYRRGGSMAYRARSHRGRWSRERGLLYGLGDKVAVNAVADAEGGLIASWTVPRRGEVALRVGAGAPGRRVRARTVDRFSRPALRSAGNNAPGLSSAGNGAALLTWGIGRQYYRSERRAGGRFSGRRLAFALDPESQLAGQAVSASGRWVIGLITGGRFRDDAFRLRAITARFGGRPTGPRLIGSAPTLQTVPPVIDRAGRITFVSAGLTSIGARTGR